MPWGKPWRNNFAQFTLIGCMNPSNFIPLRGRKEEGGMACGMPSRFLYA